jgi:CubicO group peptidase (beta-lactamase class C family)
VADDRDIVAHRQSEALSMKLLGVSCAGALLALLAISDAQAASTKQIVDSYAKALIRDGQAVGVGVAVIYGPAAPKFFTYGNSVVGSGGTLARPFRADDLFEIGSVTKVFTTNLLGQDVHRKRVSLSDPLSNYATQLGTLKPLTSEVTLLELADFTGGMRDYAPLCSQEQIPGCLPNGRPPIEQYTAADFAAFFRETVPRDYNQTPPVPVTSLPAPYFYSDYSVGLLGLLLASRDAPLGNRDLTRWFNKVEHRILAKLGMQDTFLNVPPAQLPRRAGGYQQALARAEVSGGALTDITLISTGARYAQAPRVRVRGGGGTGAQATATLNGDKVSAITLTNGGSGYLAPATVAFNNGGSTTEAVAQVIIENGRVAAVAVLAGGAGYTQVPTVTINGGRLASGQDATATAHLVNGRVGYVTVDDGGEGYVEPLSVVIEPGGPQENAVPIWAPAGALTTTLADLAKFTRAALLSQRRATLVPPAIAHGFRIAEAAYACTGPNPDLSTCPTDAMRSGLSWAVQPADKANRIPSVISKNGGLPGFSTQISLMPDADLAIVVLVNSRSPETTQTAGPTSPSVRIANNVLYALFAACRSPSGCPR